jgi:hypothetical protein
MIRFPGMDSLPAVLLAVRWSGVIGNAVAILVVLVILSSDATSNAHELQR